MQEKISIRRPLGAASVAAVGALIIGGCSAQANSSDAPDPRDEVTFALDWAPNTNHIGVYVADALGYFADAGLDVEILPYASTAVPDLVSAGAADFGSAGQAGVQLARSAGRDVVSVFQVTQTDTGQVVFLGDRDDITRPADLDGLVFGGFGSPLYSALARAVAVDDDGTGEFEEVVLDTGAYEALSQGRIDFTLSVSTWEDIQTELDGHPYASFRYQDFGVPDVQSTGIVSSDAFLENNPDEARAFVGAVQRGYAYAAENPDDAADLLIEANPDTLGEADELVTRSTRLLAERYFVADGVEIGEAVPEKWEEFGAFLIENGVVTDGSGETLTEAPDWSAYYTNDFLG
ncbi:ABC transporter substrate-binding protein [Microbacterium gubbeenense]|uniref:ABC transporter substrate-binding protein n=1 Tax=Microbacterium gubbeenense TaxID=159896 RepID=UPI003F99B044